MDLIRIFLSFDGEHDADLRDLLHAQSRRPGSSFELCACSHGAPEQDAWEAQVRARIREADEVVVICGEHTDESSRVAEELRIAREEEKPCLFLWGRRDRMCTRPRGSERDDAMYSWTRDVLESQMAMTIRNAEPLVVPESCKRVGF
ncbi:MAG TPA: TIR domain-containing protein [Myxococcota bacterium]|nr:TIR domain-containing protein [Myxococcota bacterium]